MATTPRTVLTYNLDGVLTEFDITFEYLARKFVTVTLIGATREVLVLNTDYRFVTPTRIQTTRAWGPADNFDLIEIRRYTSATDRLVDFQDGSILRAYDLNISQIQTMHVAEEARDSTADTIAINNDGDLDARGKRIVNVADPIDDGDAMTLRAARQFDGSALNSAIKAKASEDAAKISETNAKTSETKAKTSETNAKTSETNAKASELEALAQANRATQRAAEAASDADRAFDEAGNAAASAVESLTQANRAEAEADRAEFEANKLGDMNEFAEYVKVFKDGSLPSITVGFKQPSAVVHSSSIRGAIPVSTPTVGPFVESGVVFKNTFQRETVGSILKDKVHVQFADYTSSKWNNLETIEMDNFDTEMPSGSNTGNALITTYATQKFMGTNTLVPASGVHKAGWGAVNLVYNGREGWSQQHQTGAPIFVDSTSGLNQSYRPAIKIKATNSDTYGYHGWGSIGMIGSAPENNFPELAFAMTNDQGVTGTMSLASTGSLKVSNGVAVGNGNAFISNDGNIWGGTWGASGAYAFMLNNYVVAIRIAGRAEMQTGENNWFQWEDGRVLTGVYLAPSWGVRVQYIASQQLQFQLGNGTWRAAWNA